MIIRVTCICSIIIFALLIVSLFGTLLMTIDRRWDFEGTADGWLGYWGGIVGSAIGVIGALFVLQSQIKSDQEAKKEEKVDNTFFNLLNLFGGTRSDILAKSGHKDVFESIYKEYEAHRRFFVREENENYLLTIWGGNLNSLKSSILLLYDQGFSKAIIDIEKKYPFFEEASLLEEYIKKREGLPNALTESQENNFRKLESSSEGAKIVNNLRVLLGIKRDLSHITIQQIDTMFLEFLNNMFFGLDNIIWDSWFETSHFSSNALYLVRSLVKMTFTQYEVHFFEDDKKKIIENSMKDYYGIIGKYFRMFHRIVKYLNENISDVVQRKNYIGFLRAMVNEKEIIILYYNSFFTDRGKGLGEELRKTKFFGDDKDLVKGRISHFSDDLLLWEDEDLEKMRSFKYE